MLTTTRFPADAVKGVWRAKGVAAKGAWDSIVVHPGAVYVTPWAMVQLERYTHEEDYDTWKDCLEVPCACMLPHARALQIPMHACRDADRCVLFEGCHVPWQVCGPLELSDIRTVEAFCEGLMQRCERGCGHMARML